MEVPIAVREKAMPDASLDIYMNISYAIQVVPDQCTDGTLCYRASHPELPGCTSHGDTPEEAIENLQDARRLYIQTILEKGMNVPLPRATASVVWKVFTTSRQRLVQPQLPGMEQSTQYTQVRSVGLQFVPA